MPVTHYQALLQDTPDTLSDALLPEPATLLPVPEKDSPLHDYGEILADVMAI